MSVSLDALAAALVTKIDALGLTINGAALTVERRKVCEIIETVDTLPVCLVAVHGPESAVPFDGGGAGGRMLATYMASILIVSPGNRDSITADTDLTNARRKVRGLFDRPWDLEVENLLFASREGSGQDAGAYPQNLDSLPMQVRLQIAEDAGN